MSLNGLYRPSRRIVEFQCDSIHPFGFSPVVDIYIPRCVDRSGFIPNKTTVRPSRITGGSSSRASVTNKLPHGRHGGITHKATLCADTHGNGCASEPRL
jgi:hypothetical protein